MDLRDRQAPAPPALRRRVGGAGSTSCGRDGCNTHTFPNRILDKSYCRACRTFPTVDMAIRGGDQRSDPPRGTSTCSSCTVRRCQGPRWAIDSVHSRARLLLLHLDRLAQRSPVRFPIRQLRRSSEQAQHRDRELAANRLVRETPRFLRHCCLQRGLPRFLSRSENSRFLWTR